MAVQLTAAANPANVATMHTIVPVAYAPVMTLDCSLGDTFDITLTGNGQINFINGSDGQRIIVRVKQDAVGGRVITLGSMVAMSVDIPTVTLSVSANKLDLLGLVYRGSVDQYQITSYTRGF